MVTLIWIIATLLVMSSCGPSGRGSSVWGDEAVSYFAGLSQAYTDDDIYGVLDFYSADAEIHDRTSDFLGATVPVSDWLASHRADLSRDLLNLHLGADQAVSLVVWPGSGDFGAIVTDMDGARIGRDTILVDLSSLERSLRISPQLAATYEELYVSYAAAWSEASADPAERLYADGATLTDSLVGTEAAGREEIVRLEGEASELWSTVSIESIGGADDIANGGSALFLDPISYGRDPQRALGIYQLERKECTFRTAVLWELIEGGIVDERRYPEIESFRRCLSGNLAEGWWVGLDLPQPRDEIVTGLIQTAAGVVIEVHNGTGSLDDLVIWGLEQFTAAGLAPPRVDSVTFEPTRRCEGVFGRVDSDEIARDLVLCIYEQDLCRDPGTCGTYPLAIRTGMLHELAHAWMLDQVGDRVRAEVLLLSGREIWADESVPWVERGVEYAAEILAWGLADEVIGLERLGGPPCEQVVAVFQLLTGRLPRHHPSGCPTAG